VRVDVRVLAATNKELPAEIRAGRFREDLYFRLNVIPIFVPPLHGRREDIPLLAEFFMAGFAKEYGRRIKVLDPSAVAALQEYPWPGNVRELRNVIERLIIMVPGDTISVRDLGFLEGLVLPEPDAPAGNDGEVRALQAARSQFEREYILKTLASQNGNISRTADLLGVERSNFYRKMRALGIVTRPGERDEETA